MPATPRTLSLWLSGLLFTVVCAVSATAAERPNVVLLLVDDAGLMDFSAFGGEAAMPNIDALANNGVRFSNYHSSPLCAPSRAMLLTGLDNHRTGIATIAELVRDEDRSQPGYSMSLEPGVRTVADDLRERGYRTYMTGKWHMGSADGDLPVDHGFDRSFILDASGADNWEQKSYMPFYPEAPWFEDDKPGTLPDDFYSSKFMVDKLIDYLDEDADSDAPFFAHIGFQAIHIPIQTPPEFTANYDGVFDAGWEVLREARWLRAQQLGLIPQDAPLAPMPASLRSWDSLPPDQQALYSKAMAVNAGMLEAMDFHVGRLIDHLKQSGEFANTLFIVTSDNGPAATDVLSVSVMSLWLKLNGYNTDIETLGERGSMAFIGPEWANAAAAPGDLFKFYTAEGGIHVPLVMSGPGLPRGTVDSLAMVTDITPTILDYTRQPTDPATSAKDGLSLRTVIDGQASFTHAPDKPVAMEVSGNAAVFLGSHKLTRNTQPFGAGQWQLFDMVADPGEVNDLSAQRPALRQEMLAHYATYVQEFGVIDLGDNFDIAAQLQKNVTAKVLPGYLRNLALIVIGVMALIGGLLYQRRRRRQLLAST